jgi:hypothetical protein
MSYFTFRFSVTISLENLNEEAYRHRHNLALTTRTCADL